MVRQRKGAVEVKWVPWGKIGIAISQVLASLELCFYERSIVRSALRRNILLVMNLIEKSVIPILPPQTLANENLIFDICDILSVFCFEKYIYISSLSLSKKMMYV